MSINAKGFRKKWNWSHTPYFGKIAGEPNKSYLLTGRDQLLSDAASDLERQRDLGDQGIVLVCGSPGVGKSAFIQTLFDRHFPQNSKRVTLIRGIHDPLFGYSKMPPQEFLRVFSEVETFLHQIIEGREIDNHSTSIQSKANSIIEKIDDSVDAINGLYADLVRDSLFPLCDLIKSKGADIEQYYLAIDDMDYMHPDSQTLILSILCSLATITDNPKILYSCRPVTALMASHAITTLFSHQTSEPIEVPMLSASYVIDNRCSDGGKFPSAVNPIGQGSVREVVDQLCSGNLREALQYAVSAQQFPHRILASSEVTYDAQTFLRLLFRDFDRREGELEGAKKTQILDIFQKERSNDMYPSIYCALITVDEASEPVIDEDFFQAYRVNAARMNKNIDVNKITTDEILKIIQRCHKAHLVRRVGVHAIDQYMGRNFTDGADVMRDISVRLTARGKRLAMFSRDETYQKLSAFFTWRTSVQNFIANHSFKLLADDDGEMIAKELGVQK